jgi:hypothetical protein
MNIYIYVYYAYIYEKTRNRKRKKRNKRSAHLPEQTFCPSPWTNVLISPPSLILTGGPHDNYTSFPVIPFICSPLVELITVWPSPQRPARTPSSPAARPASSHAHVVHITRTRACTRSHMHVNIVTYYFSFPSNRPSRCTFPIFFYIVGPRLPLPHLLLPLVCFSRRRWARTARPFSPVV